MSVSRNGRWKLTSKNSPSTPYNHLWISDKLLDNAWTTFIRPTRCASTGSRRIKIRQSSSSPAVNTIPQRAQLLQHNDRFPKRQLRFGSSTPGPLEAQKRATKKKRMTGLAYNPAPGPEIGIPFSFSLKSWSPFKPASPESQMKYEPPNLRSWASTDSDTLAPIFAELPQAAQSGQPPDHSNHGSDRGQAQEVDSNHQTEPCNRSSLAVDHNLSLEEQGVAEGEDCISLVDGQEEGTLRSVVPVAGLEEALDNIENQEAPILSELATPSATWLQTLEHQSVHEPQAIAESLGKVTQWLVDNVKNQADYACNAQLLCWMRSWLRTSRGMNVLASSHLRLVLDRAPGRHDVPDTLVQTHPARHRIFSDLCVWYLDAALKNVALTEKLVESRVWMKNIMHALAKCDFPETSCRIAADFCDKVAGTSAKERDTLVFLQEYCFMNSKAGPFQNGVSIYRCLPLAGFLKGASMEPWMQRNIQHVTMHRLGNHSVAEGVQFSTQLNYWFKTLRISGIAMTESIRGFVTRTVALMDEAQLLADCLAPLTRAQRCHAMLEAWVPRGYLQATFLFTQRQRQFSLSESQYETVSKWWYWNFETPYTSMTAALLAMSPSLLQEVLPRLLHCLVCLGELGHVCQISNYLNSKDMPIPYHILLSIFKPMMSKGPAVVEIVRKDRRQFALHNPELMEDMIHHGAYLNIIHYIIQRYLGLPTLISRKFAPPSSAIPITKEHSEMIYRAANAIAILPTDSRDEKFTRLRQTTSAKFRHIIRLIALYTKQPAAMEERLVRTLYHVVVMGPIDAKVNGGRDIPVSAWRLAVVNRIASLFGYHEARKFYTAQALEHDRLIDVPVLRQRSLIDERIKGDHGYALQYQQADASTMMAVDLLEDTPRPHQEDMLEGIRLAPEGEEEDEPPTEDEERQMADNLADALTDDLQTGSWSDGTGYSGQDVMGSEIRDRLRAWSISENPDAPWVADDELLTLQQKEDDAWKPPGKSSRSKRQ